MQTRRAYTLRQTLWWSKRYVVFLLVWSTIAVVLDDVVGVTGLRLPWLPMSLIGIAVAFTLGFKNNSSYARLWEARQIWGAIVNTSRAWGIFVKDFVTTARAHAPLQPAQLHTIHRELVYRHLAWLTALRYQLRATRSWEHNGRPDDEALRASMAERTVPIAEAMAAYVEADERSSVLAAANPATQLLARQSARLRELERLGLVDDFRHMELARLVVDLYAQQGKCERIKNFPFPRQYATLNMFALWAFILLLPFGLLSTFENVHVWLSVPFSALVGWIFITMELIGDYSENPFEGLWNDVPITALARTIEIDLRQMLGETDVPPALQPVGDILS